MIQFTPSETAHTDAQYSVLAVTNHRSLSADGVVTFVG